MECGARLELTQVSGDRGGEGAGRGLCLYQLILTRLYHLLIESLPDDFSCLPSQLLECGRECCQINWC